MTVVSSVPNVTLQTQANVYFDGKCVSHAYTLADGTRKSAGVILPAALTFTTGAPEIMQGVAGCCRVRLAGDSEWKTYGAGESFDVPGNSSFDIEVSGEPYHYICHYA